jgi:hypothetical protein
MGLGHGTAPGKEPVGGFAERRLQRTLVHFSSEDHGCLGSVVAAEYSGHAMAGRMSLNA